MTVSSKVHEVGWKILIGDNIETTAAKRPRYANLKDIHFEWIANSPIVPLDGPIPEALPYGHCASPNFQCMIEHKYNMWMLSLDHLEYRMNTSVWEGFCRNERNVNPFEEEPESICSKNWDYDHRIVKPYEWSTLRKIEKPKPKP
jgi:hypothetical protein